MAPLSHYFPLDLRHYLLTDTESINVWLNLDSFGNVFPAMPVFWHRELLVLWHGRSRGSSAGPDTQHSWHVLSSTQISPYHHLTISQENHQETLNADMWNIHLSVCCSMWKETERVTNVQGGKKKKKQISISYPLIKGPAECFPTGPTHTNPSAACDLALTWSAFPLMTKGLQTPDELL